jgi:FkbM family methyltransferase
LILSFPLHDKRKNINLNSDTSVSNRYIYIDIGCFDGETIEHFIYFNPNSSFYDIITFEPDPNNYQLCKQRLTQPKYSNLNIIFIQKVVWIRDEKVFFRINHGRKSRINLNVTGK